MDVESTAFGGKCRVLGVWSTTEGGEMGIYFVERGRCEGQDARYEFYGMIVPIVDFVVFGICFPHSICKLLL